MNAKHPTGLGAPEVTSKKTLSQPPEPRHKEKEPEQQGRNDSEKPSQRSKAKAKSTKRVRITTELTHKAMTILQELQHRHRLRTGKVLPLWKATSRAIEYYGETQKRK
jgi:hypothetical protein